MLEDAVESDGCFYSHQRNGVLSQADVYALDCVPHNIQIQFHIAILRENVHCPGPQEHDVILELRDDVLGDELGQDLHDLLALGHRRPQLANQVHGQLLLHRAGHILQLALEIVHVLEKEHSRLVDLSLLVRFAAQLREPYPHVSRHSLQVSEVDRGLVLSRQKLDWFSVGQLLVLGLQSQIVQ